jgi:hypothetical protein
MLGADISHGRFLSVEWRHEPSSRLGHDRAAPGASQAGGAASTSIVRSQYTLIRPAGQPAGRAAATGQWE